MSKTLSAEIESRSPQSPDRRLALVPECDVEAVRSAAETARAVQCVWSKAGAGGRANVLTELAQQLRRDRGTLEALIVDEVGKPVGEAAAEVTRAISICEYYAQRAYAPLGEVLPPSASGRLFVERRPRGVAGIITPWNFPVAIPLWKSLPALAAGNAVLLKPAPESTATAQWLGEVSDQTLPEGLLQVLPGSGATGAAVVAVSDVVSFTGSEAVGRAVATEAASRGIPVQAEMGGQNAAIVLEDADVDAAAAHIASAAMSYAGQKCTATRRVVAVGDRGRKELVRDAVVRAVAALGVGDPAADGVSVGPLISRRARDRARTSIARAVSDGARIVFGGKVPPRSGWYLEPTVLDGVPPDDELACEELFGPVLSVFGAGDVDEAVRIAEGTRYGLVTSIHGRDATVLQDVAARVSTGMIKVNAPTTGVDFYAPFGGEHDSSYGLREQGESATDFYTSVHTVTFASHS